ncbi:pyruvate phosphate dikinase [Streptomyces sp. ISL-22]|uniref:PEP/pyruvate-binding domain-containing protein n=1 Tax=unclassified Streptomyces TaxID=2593676 RepID=UPI001BE6C92D|nr:MULTISPECIES: PEP/pyruvate-binding domain-containing protein [unclassified Streptomyces]MBT2417617.1 pyruvate phosphate dikinase [Streptomyces sp. ISL-24]MBT2433417.1 pyruvate phosphate dikinase [Streptomyces sp. ISL-22]
MTTLDERHGEGAHDGEEHRGDVALDRAQAYGPAIVPLDQPGAALPRLIGSKAANLARAARAGLPVLPGFVIPHPASADTASTDTVTLRRAWDELSDGGARPLVVRSSSPQEDTEESSLAGQFASVLDVRGWRDFRTAVQTVLDSAHRSDGSTAPMAVLVQPMLTARVGGVLFGADPVAGRADRMLVSAVRGGPDSLVSGAQSGTNYWLSRHGRLLRTESSGNAGGGAAKEPHVAYAAAGSLLTHAELFRLARLARQVRRVFGGPQDIEFGFDADGRLWLFQSRPITAIAARPARGARLLGPGPVAETLPEQLAPLEEDLWVAPMARGLAAALDIGGTAPRRLLNSVPVVTTVAGRAAADLRLLGTVPPRHRWLALLNPAPGARRLAAAWRVGRLASSLPGLATDLTADVDHRLAEIPSPSGLSASDLAAELRWTRRVLVSLHAQEALAGALLEEPPKSRTAAGTALAALAEARARGVPDDQAVAAAPVILALTAPSLRGRGRLPGASSAPRPVIDAPAAAGAGPGPELNTPLLGQGRTSLDLRPATSPPGRETTYPAPTSNGSRPPAPRPPALEPAGRAAPTSAAFAIYAAPHARATQATSHIATSQVITTTAAPQATSATAAPQATSATGAPQATPATPQATRATATAEATRLTAAALPPRESLRLRIRWVQELQARLVREVARRLGIPVERVGLLRWAELAAVLDGGALPGDLHARVPQAESPPLPDAFRLADGQVVVAERGEDRGDGVRGVSAGRVVGTAWDGAGPRPKDAVLVVRTLDPALAPLLPGLTGLVAQTGSPLSHLAVLAREYGLPAVVGAADAVRRFPPGSRLTVDGTAGDVRLGDAS